LLTIRNFFVDYREYYLNLPNVIGASGAVYGILLAFGMLFPNTLIFIYFLFPIKAKYFVIIYGLIELIYGVTGANAGVAHFAHLGGMIFGFFLILYWRKQGRLY
jgi:membrane associated rhomboid family serine protease